MPWLFNLWITKPSPRGDVDWQKPNASTSDLDESTYIVISLALDVTKVQGISYKRLLGANNKTYHTGLDSHTS